MTTSTFAAITGDFSAQLAPEHQAVATLLERIFILEELPPWHSNRLKRLVKTPKLEGDHVSFHYPTVERYCLNLGFDWGKT